MGYWTQSTAAKADARWPPLTLGAMQVARIYEHVSELLDGIHGSNRDHMVASSNDLRWHKGSRILVSRTSLMPQGG